jgi:8-oxo-dGTP diphosphatase
MSERTDVLVAVAVARRRGAVLLVGQRRGQSALAWSLPAGAAEGFEPAVDTLNRELKEETGLQVAAVHRLAYIVQVDQPADNARTLALVFETSVAGEPRPGDPDGEVEAAQFFALDEAVRLLGALPSRAMAEPAIEYLTGASPAGTFWSYRMTDYDTALTGRVCPDELRFDTQSDGGIRKT